MPAVGEDLVRRTGERVALIVSVLGALVGCAGSSAPADGRAGAAPGGRAQPAVTPQPTGFAFRVQDRSPAGTGKEFANQLVAALPSNWKRFESLPEDEAGLLALMVPDGLTRLIAMNINVNRGMSDGYATIKVHAECIVPAPADGKVEVEKEGERGRDADTVATLPQDTAAEFVRAVETKLEPVPIEKIRARLVELQEQPVRAKLNAGKQSHESGDPRGALAHLDEAAKLAESTKNKALVDEIAAYRIKVADAFTTVLMVEAKGQDPVKALTAFVELRRVAPTARAAEVEAARSGVVDAGVRALGSAIETGNAKAARSLLVAIDSIAPERGDELRPLKAKLEELSKKTAADFVTRAGALPATSYQEAEVMVREALDLDPENAKAKQLLVTIEKKRDELEPREMKDINMQRDGKAAVIDFALANQQGKATVASGVATVRFLLTAAGMNHVIQVLYEGAIKVDAKDFANRGLIGLAARLPRIKYEDITNPMRPYEWGTRQFATTLHENKSAISIEVEFTPTGARESVKLMKEVNPFSF